MFTKSMDLVEERKHFLLNTKSLKVLFRKTSTDSLAHFLKHTNLFDKL